MSEKVDASSPVRSSPLSQYGLCFSLWGVISGTISLHYLGKLSRKFTWISSTLLGTYSAWILVKQPPTPQKPFCFEDVKKATSFDFQRASLSSSDLDRFLKAMPNVKELYFETQLFDLKDQIPEILFELQAQGCEIYTPYADELILALQAPKNEEEQKILTLARSICTHLEPTDSHPWTAELLAQEIPLLSNLSSLTIHRSQHHLFDEKVWEALKQKPCLQVTLVEPTEELVTQLMPFLLEPLELHFDDFIDEHNKVIPLLPQFLVEKIIILQNYKEPNVKEEEILSIEELTNVEQFSEEDIEALTNTLSFDFEEEPLSTEMLERFLNLLPQVKNLYFNDQLVKLGDQIPNLLFKRYQKGCAIHTLYADELIVKFQEPKTAKERNILTLARAICTHIEPTEEFPWTEELLKRELPLIQLQSAYLDDFSCELFDDLSRIPLQHLTLKDPLARELDCLNDKIDTLELIFKKTLLDETICSSLHKVYANKIILSQQYN